jgi:hypothetical protein
MPSADRYKNIADVSLISCERERWRIQLKRLMVGWSYGYKNRWIYLECGADIHHELAESGPVE